MKLLRAVSYAASVVNECMSSVRVIMLCSVEF